MRKVSPLAAFISVLLLSAVAGTQLVNLANANPYQFILMDEVPPAADTEPPAISIIAPENDTAYVSHGLVLSLNVSVKYSGNAKALFFWKIYYEADWKKVSTLIYEFIPETGKSTISEFNSNIELTDVPEGNHTLVVYTVEGGRYEEPDPGSAGFVTLYYPFKITGSSSVSFTIDTVAPEVTVLSPENKAYDSSYVPLNFTANESASQFSYILDGQKNMTIDGNVTLSGLPIGAHNITIYAQDAARNVGASENIAFTVAEPSPVALIATASGASVIVILSCLLVYFKKRKR